jgi:hypothetical protein
MANKRWLGTATAVAQVRTTEITGAAAGSTITTTLTAEDGSTQSVVATMTNSTLADQATVYRNALAASSQSEFQKLTYSVDGAVVTITASLAGRPFSMSITGTTGSASASNTAVTANAGPHDFKTAANFDPSGVPASQDILQFTDGASDVLYGLDNNAVSLNQLIVTRGYRGNIGTNTSPLKISTNGSGDPNSLDLAGSGFYYNFEGTYTALNISGNQGTAKVKGNIGGTKIVGPEVRGAITIDATTTTNNDITTAGISSTTLITIPSTAVKTANLFIDSGRVELAASTVSGSKAIVTGGALATKDSGKVDAGSTSHAPAAIAVFGGRYEHESDQALTGGGRTLAVFKGEADFSKVRSTTGSTEQLALGAVDVLGGSLRIDAPGGLVSLGATSLQLGGRVFNSPSTKLGFSKG